MHAGVLSLLYTEPSALVNQGNLVVLIRRQGREERDHEYWRLFVVC